MSHHPPFPPQKKPLHFQIEALGCLSSFSGAYHDSEICVGGALLGKLCGFHVGAPHGFFLSNPATFVNQV